MSNSTDQADAFRCYLFNNATPDAWGDCCDDLSIVPKPVWVVFLLSVPIEAVLAGADVRATAGMYEEKSNQTAVIFLLYNFVTLGLLAYQFDWGSCEASVEGVWECYQGLLFMFYNSTAALASMTLWMLIIMRKYYPQLYFMTRLVISPRFLWRWFDRLNLKNGGTHATVERWNMISTSTKLFWYNKVGIVTTLLFGGITHIIPMFFAYPYILVSMCIALVYSHSLRLGYTGLKNTTNLWSTIWNVLVFYPLSLVVSPVFLALSPLSLLLKVLGCHSMDKEDANLAMVNPEDSDVIEIFFKTAGGGLITLEFDKDESVQAVIPKVQDNLGFDFIKSTIHLQFNGEELDETETVTLAQYGIKSGDVLNVVVEPDKIEIRVKLEDGTILLIKLSARATVSLLMDELAKETRLEKSNQYLLVRGERVADLNMPVSRLDSTTELELFPLQMSLRITLSSNRSVRATVDRDASYEDLRRTIAKLEKTSESLIHLLFEKVELEDGPTLHAQGLRSNSELVCVKEVKIYIRVEDGQDLTLQLDVNSSVKKLMERLEPLANIPVASQFLFRFRQLSPDESLADLDGYEMELFRIELTLEVELPDGRTEQVDCLRTETYNELRRKVARLERVGRARIQLFRDGDELEKGKSLHLLGLNNEVRLVCTRNVQVRVAFRTSAKALPKRFDLTVNAKATVEEFKKLLEESHGTSFTTNILMFKNEEVKDEGKLMEEFGRNKSKFDICPSMLSLSVVNQNTAETFQLSISTTATFRELRERAAELTGLSIEEMQLSLPRLQMGDFGTAVEDTSTLFVLGVRDGDVVEVSTPEAEEDDEEIEEASAEKDDKKGKKKKKLQKEKQPAPRPSPRRQVPGPMSNRLSQRLSFSMGGAPPPVPPGGAPRGPPPPTTGGPPLGGPPPAPLVKKHSHAKYLHRDGPEQEQEVVVETKRPQQLRASGFDGEGQIIEDSRLDVGKDQAGFVPGEVDVKEQQKAARDKRAEQRRERRRRVLAYVKDILRNLCMFDPNGKVIMFAAATTFLCFTFSANYGLILYSGAPYLDVIVLDWNSRDSLQWFQCTATNFADINAFGLIDFLGLAIGTVAGLIEFVDFLVSI